ncbi:MAG: transcriptional regulator [Candidatus Schekmanbacteria bacterium]|nr:transcriptional regulator [Candidatus Schekmanbacteria bacterium]
MKTLGTVGTNLLHKAVEQGKIIFTLEDALQITNTSYKATAELVRYLIQQRWLVRLSGGKYLIVSLEGGLEGIPSVNRFLVAKALAGQSPYFISHYSAMEIHGLLTQPLVKVYVTIAGRLSSRMVLGTEYRFVKSGPDNLWGLRDEWVTPTDKVTVSDLERTLLDGLKKPDYCGGISEVAKGLWIDRERIDYKSLKDYIIRMNNKAAAKRLGYLLELYKTGPTEFHSFLKGLVDANYSLLDPMLPSEGQIDSTWRLRLNLNPQELQAIVRT